MSDLEQRYLVLKHADLDNSRLTKDELAALGSIISKVENFRTLANKAPFRAVVIEEDWPEYAPTVSKLQARINGTAIDTADGWVIAREVALDVGFGDDVRTGGAPELGYAVISNTRTFETQAAAREAAAAAKLPLGWVVMPVSQLLPRVAAEKPSTNIDEYAEWARSMWFSSGKKNDKALEQRDFMIASLGLAGETGEALEHIKKWVRDGDLDKTAFKKELADVVFYWARLCLMFGFKPSEVLQAGRDKLNDRLARGTLRGSGDER